MYALTISNHVGTIPQITQNSLFIVLFQDLFLLFFGDAATTAAPGQPFKLLN